MIKGKPVLEIDEDGWQVLLKETVLHRKRKLRSGKQLLCTTNWDMGQLQRSWTGGSLISSRSGDSMTGAVVVGCIIFGYGYDAKIVLKYLKVVFERGIMM